MRRWMLVLLARALFLTSCSSYQTLLYGLSFYQVSSCVWFEGHAGSYASLQVVMATGQADITHCLNY